MEMLIYPNPPLEALLGPLKAPCATESPMAPSPLWAALADPQNALLALLGIPRPPPWALPRLILLIVKARAVGQQIVSCLLTPRLSPTTAALASPLLLRLVAVRPGGTPRPALLLGFSMPWFGDLDWLL